MTTGAGQRRTSRLVTLALCAALSVSGCSSGSDPGSGSATSSASPSATTTTTTTRAATASKSPTRTRPPAAPAATRGPAGQKRFARYVTRLWGYSLRTNDATALTALSAPGKKCLGCKVFAASLKKRKKQGWYVDFPGVTVKKVTVKPVDDNVYAKATVDVPRSDSYNSDGSFRNTNQAHRGATFEVLMHRGAKRFQLLSFTVS